MKSKPIIAIIGQCVLSEFESFIEWEVISWLSLWPITIHPHHLDSLCRFLPLFHCVFSRLFDLKVTQLNAGCRVFVERLVSMVKVQTANTVRAGKGSSRSKSFLARGQRERHVAYLSLGLPARPLRYAGTNRQTQTINCARSGDGDIGWMVVGNDKHQASSVLCKHHFDHGLVPSLDCETY